MKFLIQLGSLITLLLFPINVFATADINSSLFQSIVRELSMQGHSDHDYSNCTVIHVYYDEVTEMIDKGWGKQEILDYYVEEYGQAALKTPRPEGSGLIAWIGPGVGLVFAGIGGLSVIRSLVNRKGKSEIGELAMTQFEEEVYDRLIEEERKKLF